METYIGQRYVPKIEGEWNKNKSYENLSIVTTNNTSYTSKKIVPVGIDILNEIYWVKTGDYIAQVDDFKEEFNAQLAHKAEQEELNTVSGQIDNLIANAGNTDGNAELLDIRIGWDGVTYPTAGDAVRSIQQFMTEENENWSVI